MPPAAAVYHNRLVPVAVNGFAGLPYHNCTGVFTVGAGGRACPITVMAALGLSHWPFMVWLT